jgi:hypothetical protein
VNDEIMASRESIQIELIKLADGGRLMRLTEPESGLSLERRLNDQLPVARQKKSLLDAFEAAISQVQLNAA